jgi:iron complex transport system permease protein
MEKEAAEYQRPIPEELDPMLRYRIGLVVLCALFVVVFFASFLWGRFPVSPPDVISVMLSPLFPSLIDGLDPSAVAAVANVRLPRVIVAAFVGAALSVAGASYQGLFQNPMVSQDILGASSGAAFGAAAAIFLGLGAFGITTLAFCFGLIAVGVAYLISRTSPLSSLLAMILAGMVVSALFSAATSFIKLVADTEDVLPAITYWLMGSLSSIREGDVWFCIPLIIVASVPIIALRWRINILATGEEEARSLGLDVKSMRLVIIMAATLLTATCVSVSGLVGWVGLIIPHFCRLVFGYDYRRLIPASLLLGATFLIIVDDVARLIATSEIPIGILTAVIGAPIFIFLIMRGGRLGHAKRS